VVDVEDLALAVGAVDQVAAVVGDQGGQLDLGVGQAVGDGGEQVVDPLAGRGEIIGTRGTGGPGGRG
jgi:hypothetical protein